VTSGGFRSQLAVLHAGFQSLGIVMGAGAYQIYQPFGCYGVGPQARGAWSFDSYEQALRDAWWDVVARLEDEARQIGAHGVIGVYLIERRPTAGQSMMQLQLIGTAVRVGSEPPLERPFLSMLSMHDTLALLLRGWAASTLAVGVSAVHVHQWNASPMMQGVAFSNAEMEAPTAGMAEARSRAERQVRKMLIETKAQGVVASRVELKRVTQSDPHAEGVLIECRIRGTGVVAYRKPVAGLTGVRDLAAAGRSVNVT